LLTVIKQWPSSIVLQIFASYLRIVIASRLNSQWSYIFITSQAKKQTTQKSNSSHNCPLTLKKILHLQLQNVDGV
jgi:hypothetical protein